MRLINKFSEKVKRKLRMMLPLFFYLLFKNNKIKKNISIYGFTNIRIYRVKQWRFNLKKKTSRVFYTAIFNENVYFIKIVNNLRNEVFIHEYMKRCGIKFTPELLMSDEQFIKNRSMIVTEYIPDLVNFNVPNDIKEFEDICKELEDILECMRKFDIIHGDLSEFNVALDKKKRIIIFDWANGWAPGAENHMLPRTVYKKVDGANIYCNAHCFLRVFDECGIPRAFKQSESYMKIERLVGKHTHTVKI